MLKKVCRALCCVVVEGREVGAVLDAFLPLLSCQVSSALYCSSMMEARQPYCSAAECTDWVLPSLPAVSLNIPSSS